jgi:hypothetical protein
MVMVFKTITLCLSCISGNHTDSNRVERYIGKILRLSHGKMQGMAYQVIKQALVWTKQETPLSYEIENRILAGYLGNTVKSTELGRGDFT